MPHSGGSIRLGISGAPGVGKTTALEHLQGRLTSAALLDADHVWRVSDDLAIPENRSSAIGNVVSVMRGYFEAGCETGVLSWVFARDLLYQPVLDGLSDRRCLRWCYRPESVSQSQNPYLGRIGYHHLGR